jgi:hypothetical protein
MQNTAKKIKKAMDSGEPEVPAEGTPAKTNKGGGRKRKEKAASVDPENSEGEEAVEEAPKKKKAKTAKKTKAQKAAEAAAAAAEADDGEEVGVKAEGDDDAE